MSRFDQYGKLQVIWDCLAGSLSCFYRVSGIVRMISYLLLHQDTFIVNYLMIVLTAISR
jgi:hypothetical protein